MFEVVAVLPRVNKNNNQKSKLTDIASKQFLTADDFNQQVLLSYPVKTEELDVFKHFLNKAPNKKHGTKPKTTKNQFQPKAIKRVANSHMILQMVAANMGIATLPEWLVNSLTLSSLLQTKRIGKEGIHKILYARYKKQSNNIDIIEQIIPQTIAAFNKVNNTDMMK
jgi:LysR family transcriptional regulator for metE and metH